MSTWRLQYARSHALRPFSLVQIYLPPFDGAVQAGVLSVMCSYNRINDVYACENAWTLNGNLKGILGFQGWVVRFRSSWGGAYGRVVWW